MALVNVEDIAMIIDPDAFARSQRVFDMATDTMSPSEALALVDAAFGDRVKMAKDKAEHIMKVLRG